MSEKNSKPEVAEWMMDFAEAFFEHLTPQVQAYYRDEAPKNGFAPGAGFFALLLARKHAEGCVNEQAFETGLSVGELNADADLKQRVKELVAVSKTAATVYMLRGQRTHAIYKRLESAIKKVSELLD